MFKVFETFKSIARNVIDELQLGEETLRAWQSRSDEEGARLSSVVCRVSSFVSPSSSRGPPVSQFLHPLSALLFPVLNDFSSSSFTSRRLLLSLECRNYNSDPTPFFRECTGTSSGTGERLRFHDKLSSFESLLICLEGGKPSFAETTFSFL